MSGRINNQARAPRHILVLANNALAAPKCAKRTQPLHPAHLIGATPENGCHSRRSAFDQNSRQNTYGVIRAAPRTPQAAIFGTPRHIFRSIDFHFISDTD
jgi:hypothetical protein